MSKNKQPSHYQKEYQDEIIKTFNKQLSEMLDEIKAIKDDNEYASKLDTLFKIYKYFKYFNELEPTLDKAISEIEAKRKFNFCNKER